MKNYNINTIFILCLTGMLFTLLSCNKKNKNEIAKSNHLNQQSIDSLRSSNVVHIQTGITKTENLKIDSIYNCQTAKPTVNENHKVEFMEIVPVVYRPSKNVDILFPGERLLSLKVSPDGNRIVLNKIVGTAKTISIYNLQTNCQLFLDLPLDSSSNPSWNYNGTKIVFVGMKGDIGELYIFNLITKKLELITDDKTRVKSWPRFSPHKFDDNYRIAYVSEKNKRKDIWWVRESGEYDQPITLPREKISEYSKNPYWTTVCDGMTPKFITAGGDFPEWAPSGNLLLYKTSGRK